MLVRLGDGREFAVGVGGLRIGRRRGVDLALKDRTVSRHHADVRYENGRYVLYDNSTNGTWVNGTLVVAAQPLRDGDDVKFGNVEFRFLVKTVSPNRVASLQEATQPSRVPEYTTARMKGGKRRRRLRRLRRRRFRVWHLLSLLVLLVAATGAAIYFLFPELVDRLVALLPSGAP